MFDLNRRVKNVESLPRDGNELLQDPTPAVVLSNHCMAGHGMHTGSQCPDMKIVNGVHPHNLAKGLLHYRQIDVGRRSFQED